MSLTYMVYPHQEFFNAFRFPRRFADPNPRLQLAENWFSPGSCRESACAITSVGDDAGLEEEYTQLMVTYGAKKWIDDRETLRADHCVRGDPSETAGPN